MLLRVTVSAFNDRGPRFMEQVLAAIHQGAGRRREVTWSLARIGAHVALLCEAPEPLRPLVEGQLLSHYPSAQLERLTSSAKAIPEGHGAWIAELAFGPEAFPIRRYPEFDDPTTRTNADPLTGFLASLAGLERDPLRARIEFTVRPARLGRLKRAKWALAQRARPLLARHETWAKTFMAWSLSPHWWRRCVARCAVRLAGPLPKAQPHSAASSRTHDREDVTQAAYDKLGRQLFETEMRVVVTAPEIQEARALAKLDELVGALGQVSHPHQASLHLRSLRRSTSLRSRQSRSFLLSAEELATLWHPPTFTIQAPTIDLSLCRQLEPPAVLPDPRREEGIAVLGRAAFRDDRRTVGIRTEDRRRHLYIVGKTGMGKSTLLSNLLVDDIRAGRGCCLVDPHGDLAEAVLAAVPSQRTNDVVLFDAGDQQHPVSFNPLADCSPQARPLVASGMLSAFKKLYGDSWGPRMEHIFRNCLLALLETPGASLVSLVQLLGDVRYRQKVVNRVTDPVVRAFWQQEFAALPPKFQAEAIAPIQNKVGQFVSSPLLRHILGQSRSTIDLRRVMDEGRVLIVNLSKGRVGEDAANLLGSLAITALQLAAMSRADVSEAGRRDCYLYVDEFQNFATESFATILSEARKYRLCLTLANQYLDQMDEATAAAVFGNVGSLLCFQVGANDAELLATQLGGPATPEDLLALPRYDAYLRLLIDGQPSRSFSLGTLPPSQPQDATRSEVIRRVSRRRYGRPVAQVTAEIEQAFTARK